jgi:hypothetical protein
MSTTLVCGDIVVEASEFLTRGTKYPVMTIHAMSASLVVKAEILVQLLRIDLKFSNEVMWTRVSLWFTVSLFKLIARVKTTLLLLAKLMVQSAILNREMNNSLICGFVDMIREE